MIGRGLRDKRVVASCVLAMIAVFSISAATTVPEASIASLYPKIIMGYVYDSTMTPIAGAEVDVASKNGATTVYTLSDTTDSNGLYLVTFDGPYWEVGYTFEASAEFNLIVATNSTVANGDFTQYLNVTLSLVIPEFGSLLGQSAFGLSACFVAVIVLISRRKAKSA